MTVSELVARISKRRVLVIGDAILDVAYYGRPLGPSVENSAVTTYANERVEYSYGGSSLVVRNLLALGAAADYVTVLGDDENLEKCCTFTGDRLRFNTKIIEPGRMNTVKERFWADGKLVFKWDFRSDREIGHASQHDILSAVTQWLDGASSLVIADNRHGVLAEPLIPKLLASARKAKVPVYVDSQVTISRSSNHRYYRGADVVCLNLKEAQAVASNFDPRRPKDGLDAIQRELQAGVVIVKLSEYGSAAWVAGKVVATPAFGVEAKDTTGAGDAFIAALAAVNGAPWGDALAFANQWAALSTTVSGPNPPTLEQFEKYQV